ncbi:hypothetical protein GCM10028784_01460 [Myceligenerans cantabricum]
MVPHPPDVAMRDDQGEARRARPERECESGYFDRSLTVYGQEGEPWGRCGTAVRREQFMNCSSYFCPRCQREPRS